MLDTVELVKQLPEMFVSCISYKSRGTWVIVDGIRPTDTEFINFHGNKNTVFKSEQEMRIYCDMMKWEIVDWQTIRDIRLQNLRTGRTSA